MNTLDNAIEQLDKTMKEIRPSDLDKVANIYVLSVAVQEFCLQHLKPNMCRETKHLCGVTLNHSRRLLNSFERGQNVNTNEEIEDSYYEMQGWLYEQFNKIIDNLKLGQCN